jgi:uncharacterized protein YjbI with pentapeptide repeats
MEIRNKEGKIIFNGNNLSNADLNNADLNNADLCNLNLYGVNLSYSYLRYANLSGSNLICANLIGSDLFGVNLTSANLSYTDLYNTDLYNANLHNTNLYGADLRNIIIEKSIVCINGSKHPLIYIENIKQFQIGCIIQPLTWWKKNYKNIMKSADYSKEEIKEYKKYIDMVSMK